MMKGPHVMRFGQLNHLAQSGDMDESTGHNRAEASEWQ